MAALRTRLRDEVAALETRSRDEMDEMGQGLSMRGTIKMGLVGVGVAVQDATLVTLARISRGAKGQGRKICSGSEGKRPRTTGDGVRAGDEARAATVDEGRTKAEGKTGDGTLSAIRCWYSATATSNMETPEAGGGGPRYGASK